MTERKYSMNPEQEKLARFRQQTSDLVTAGFSHAQALTEDLTGPLEEYDDLFDLCHSEVTLSLEEMQKLVAALPTEEEESSSNPDASVDDWQHFETFQIKNFGATLRELNFLADAVLHTR